MSLGARGGGGGGLRTTEIFDFGSFFGWENFGKYFLG